MEIRQRILLVDDDEAALEDLRRAVDVEKGRWDVECAASGGRALDLIERYAFDVLVSSLAMPDIDGLGLLGEVRRLSPLTVRIICSGETDLEAVMRAPGVVHQFLPRPYDVETVSSALARACRLREALADSFLRGLLGELEDLPAVPELYFELMRELRSDDVSIDRVGAIIGRDVGMTAKLLGLVNSAFFGLRRTVSSPARAVALLGLSTVRALIVSFHVFSRFENHPTRVLSFERLWEHSLQVSRLARTIARTERADKDFADQCITAGLLHDAGKLVLSTLAAERYAAIVEGTVKGLPAHELEYKGLGTSHAEVGCYILGLWGLPGAVVDAIAFHHRPLEFGRAGLSTLAVVHCADAFAHELGAEELSDLFGRLDFEFMKGADLADRLSVWYDSCEAELRSNERQR